MGRQVEECKFRRVSSDRVFCGLLEEITDVTNSHLCVVTRDVCEACCESFRPSETDPNPVIATLVFQACEVALAADGIEDLTTQKATDLQQWAEANLPAVYEGEDDIDGHDAVVHLADDAPIESVIPLPTAHITTRQCRWSAGITTSPRRVDFLAATIPDVVLAGWERPRIFSDGYVEIPPQWCDLPVTRRCPRVGAWPSYYLALTEMLMRDPDADAYVLFQDDSELLRRRDFREYLERVMWPDDVPGILSLYCSTEYTKETNGWHKFEGEWVWGAHAFVFSPEACRGLVTDDQFLQHRWDGIGDGLKGIDVAIGRWAAVSHTPIWFPTPSLLQHSGQVSTLWDNARAVGDRRANRLLKAIPRAEDTTGSTGEPPAAKSGGTAKKFVLLSTGRCGTTLLGDALQQHPQITMGGEPFCRAVEFVEFRDVIRNRFAHEIHEPFLTDLDRQVITNADYMEGVFERVDGVSIHYWHLGEEFGSVDHYLLHRSDVRIVQLIRRNDFERYVSLQMARKSQVWHLRREDNPTTDEDRPATVHISPERFLKSSAGAMNDIRRHQEFFAGKLTTIYYEDLVNQWSHSIADILQFVDVPQQRLQQKLTKVIRRPMREVVENYAEVQECCRGTFAEKWLP